MQLHECHPGSLLVIEEHGEWVMVELGALLGGGFRKKKLVPPWAALVRTIDDQSLEPNHRTLRAIDVDIPVIDVIVTIAKRREIRNINRKVWNDLGDNVSVDPLTRNAEVF